MRVVITVVVIVVVIVIIVITTSLRLLNTPELTLNTHLKAAPAPLLPG